MIDAAIAAIRKDYSQRTLDMESAAHEPVEQFSRWWDDALASKIDEVNAMTLATASAAGEPDARIVLLKSFDEKGFMFFTNYESAKGRELAENPRATLVFFWKELERQVRVSGTVSKADAGDSDEYFVSRPHGSRIGAWASPQSRVIASREELDGRVAEIETRFKDRDQMPRPEYWGGFLLKPVSIEFWQGRESRLHDRIRYRLQSGEWVRERLAP